MAQSKYSIASQKRWKGVSDEEKFKKMSIASKIRWSKVGVEERQAIALMLVRSREAKRNKKNG